MIDFHTLSRRILSTLMVRIIDSLSLLHNIDNKIFTKSKAISFLLYANHCSWKM